MWVKLKAARWKPDAQLSHVSILFAWGFIRSGSEQLPATILIVDNKKTLRNVNIITHVEPAFRFPTFSCKRCLDSMEMSY